MKTATISECTALWRDEELRIIAVQENSNEPLEIILSEKALETLKQAVTEPDALKEKELAAAKLKKGVK